MGRIGLLVLALWVAVGLGTGCSRVEVPTKVLRPAAINMAGYERVTVGAFKGQGAEALRSKFVAGLANTGRFDVLDRDSLAEVSEEMKLEMTGAAQQGEGPQSGKMMAAMAFVTANVTTHNYHQDREFSTTDQGTISRTLGRAEVAVTFKVVEIETSKILATDTLSSNVTSETNWTGGTSPDLDPSPMFDQAYTQVTEGFLKKISAWEESVLVPVYQVSGNDPNKAGVNTFKAGEYAAAAEMFQAAVDFQETKPKASPKSRSRTLYNHGTALEYSGDLKAALDRYKEAIRLHPDSAYSSAVQRVERRLREREELIRQGVIPPDP